MDRRGASWPSEPTEAGGGDTGVRITAATIEPPKGGGAISGLGQRLEHNPYDGSAVFEAPIAVPSPRGVAPSLALRYASASGNGPFGMGFDLPTPKFTRRSVSFGIPRYDDTDRFGHTDQGTLVAKLDVAGGAEERLEPADAPAWRVRAYLPRIEGAFARIEYWLSLTDGASHWIVQTNANQTHVYGQSAAARIFDPTAPWRIAEWLLEETIDAVGDKTRYSYLASMAAPGHEATSNRYLAEIAFGNYSNGPDERFNVRVVLDYGGHVGETPPPEPTGPPDARPDPFSSYGTGFEVRTAWRCRRVLVYTTHPELFDGAPTLIRALSLDYEEGPTGLSMLKRVAQRGFRWDEVGACSQEDLPPLTLAFTPFQPLAGAYAPLEVDPSGVIPGAPGEGGYMFVDLDGEGLPGMLYSAPGQVLYWPPLGEGRYGSPAPLERFPSFGDLENATLTLASLNGDGRQNLVSMKPGRAGYFTLEPSGLEEPAGATTTWSGFRPFAAIPSSYGANPGALVALNGDGRLDLLEPQGAAVRAYPSRGERGFGPPDMALPPEGFPPDQGGGPKCLDTYADLIGDGLSHRVRISQGRVEYWPDLGYGAFGSPVALANAPHYGPTFDTTRLFLADLDGSGPADLVYADFDRLKIYFNRSGNSFSAPIELMLPAPFDATTRITFADIYGTGSTCLVFTRLEPQVKHYVYAFAGQAKPYLLAAYDDAMGGRARWTYTTSVQEYLRDKRADRRWITQTYFPVQVVAEIEAMDDVAQARNVSRFAYHDGFYDPQLRQFQGFGAVESWDSETFETRQAAIALGRTDLDPLSPELFSPPAYTKAWFHTGIYLQTEAVTAHNRAQYWRGDPLQPTLPDQWIAPEILTGDTTTLRQAYAALAGRLIRREVYGLDGAANEDAPYSVSQSTTGVGLVQPKGSNPNAVVIPFDREQLDAAYERVADDPRITHGFMLDHDAYGNVTRSCTVAYPRRAGQPGGPYAYAEQEAIAVTAQRIDPIIHPGDAAEPYRWIGQPGQARAYELAGVAPTSGLYFTFEGLAAQCDEALAAPIPYGVPFTPQARQARLFQWSRSYYWDATQSTPLPLGQIAAKGLAHHGETATSTPDLMSAAFGDDGAEVSTTAGYRLDAGYWWNRGLIQHYETRADGFSLPNRTDGRFDGVSEDGPLNPTTVTTYDSPALYVTSVTRVGSVTDPVSGETREVALTATVVNDHQAGQPARITDPNGTITETAYSPLALVTATALVGAIEGRAAGDLPLATRTSTPAPTLVAITNDPAAFLQGSTTYFHYDLLSWAAERRPVSVIEVTRQRHVHQLAEGEESLLPVTVAYRDGSGRDVETRLARGRESIDGPDRWAVSGRVRLDAKGAPVETYLPFFAVSPFYGDDTPLDGPLPPPETQRYDALGRPTLTTTSKGFLRLEVYAAWASQAWDENDTVLDSPFCKTFPTNPVTPAEKRESAALAQAVRDYHTPARTVLDPSGQHAGRLAANLGAITPQTLAPAVEGQPITPQAFWDALVIDGYLDPAANVPGAAWATERLQPYDPRCRADFTALYGPVAGPALLILRQTGLTTHTCLDVQGRVTQSSDPRLFWDQIVDGDDVANFELLLDMTGAALRTISADAGAQSALADIFGANVLTIDAEGVRTVTIQDRFGRPVQIEVVPPNDASLVPRRAELTVYGELHPDPASRNLNGQPWRSYSDAGLETTDLYDLAGAALTPTQRVRADYARPADWTATAIAEIEQQQALITKLEYDAEQGRIREQTPDGGVTRFDYDLAGLIARVTFTSEVEAAPKVIVASARYSALGERLSLTYGNGVVTENFYDPATQRLATTTSTQPGGATLQAVAYTYDPVGNLTSKLDTSWETVFCYNQQVDPLNGYAYDPLYRLTEASGRQQAGASARGGSVMPFCPPDPADRQQLENYIETFDYDDGGNMVLLRHAASRGTWTTALPVEARSNRLAGLAYDTAGELTKLDALQLEWDFRGRLSSVVLMEREGGDNDSEHYLYAADGERVARITRRLKQVAGDGAAALFEVRETLFIGDYERTRVFQESGGERSDLTLSETVSIPDDEGHFCVLERETAASRTRQADGDGTWRGRFLLADQVASVTQELDDSGARLTYREYCPYGATAFVAAASPTDAATSRFEFGGKRRDDATGLYYFGARYYPSWLARWINPDPAGTIDGSNLYAYVTGNPTSFTDPTGMGKQKQNDKVSMHGVLVKKPSNHAEMHVKAEALGKLVAQEIVASGVDHKPRLKQLEKDIASIQKDVGLPIHNETTVDNALKAGLRGDKEAFDRLYRAALPGMDEQISTATMFYIAKGAGKVKMDEQQWVQFAYSFRIASRLRLETEYTGYSTDKGEVQHPTSKGSEFFSSSGKGHTYWDRARREDVVEIGKTTSATGVDRMLAMVAEAGRHSLSYGIAPSLAKGIGINKGVSPKERRRQMRRREGIKRITIMLRGEKAKKYARQNWNARWNPSRRAPPSPLRIE
jgi:RHS repeat-associated protein